MQVKEIKEIFDVETASFSCACDPKYGLIGRGKGKGHYRGYEPIEVYQIVLVDRLRKIGVSAPRIGELVKGIMSKDLWRGSYIIVESLKEIALVAHMGAVRKRLGL